MIRNDGPKVPVHSFYCQFVLCPTLIDQAGCNRYNLHHFTMSRLTIQMQNHGERHIRQLPLSVNYCSIGLLSAQLPQKREYLHGTKATPASGAIRYKNLTAVYRLLDYRRRRLLQLASHSRHPSCRFPRCIAVVWCGVYLSRVAFVGP